MSVLPSMCPHCGYNFDADTPLECGDWLLTPTSARLRGEDMGLTAGEAGVLYAIARANGEGVSTEAILNRTSDSENSNVVSVKLCRARKKIGEQRWPVVSGRGRRGGYRWKVEV